MPSCARHVVVREGEIGIYHCWSRCVQRAFLCGHDPETGIDFDYRRQWIEDLLAYQAAVFAVDVGNFSVLSNHTHLIARTRPDIANSWCDEEVAWRWKLAWPSLLGDQWMRDVTDQEIDELLLRPDKIQQIRANLSSLSWFMARWKEPIARLCNAEMDVDGHFWAQRFGARELLDEAAVLACSIYVDLNQMKAAMAQSLQDCHHSAIHNRLLAAKAREVAASLETFDATGDASEYPLPPETVEALFADCWLAPICQDGPLMTQTAVAAQKGSQVVESVAENTSGSLEAVTSPEEKRARRVAQQEQDGSASTMQPTGGSSEGEDVDSTRSTNVRCRASDNPILAIPFDAYFAVAQTVADDMMRSRLGRAADLGLADTGSSALSIMEGYGVDPAAWMVILDQLEATCRRALGAATRVAERACSAAQQWFHGIAFCREVFLDKHT